MLSEKNYNRNYSKRVVWENNFEIIGGLSNLKKVVCKNNIN